MTGQKSHCLDDDNYPVIDTYIYLQDVYNQRLEDDIMTFQKGHKTNLGHKFSKEHNLKISLALNRHIKKPCVICGKEISVKPCHLNIIHCCSKECRTIRLKIVRKGINKGKVRSPETRKKISLAQIGKKRCPRSDEDKLKISIGNKGKILSEEHRKRLSESNKGRKTWNKGLKGAQTAWNKGLTKETDVRVKKISTTTKETFSDERRKKISECNKGKKLSEERKRYLSEINTGEKSPAWRGGISFEPYCSKFNKVLKERIRERDNRTCQLCGEKENGSKLSVHHIHYDKHNCQPDLISLCKICHSKVNVNRDYWELYFIEKLRERGLNNL